MKKQNILILTTIILTLFLIINPVNAYDNSTLKAYYTFGDGHGYSLYDTASGNVMSGGYVYNSSTGKVGNSLYSSSTSVTTVTNNSYPSYDNTDMSGNYWIKDANNLGGSNFNFVLVNNVVGFGVSGSINLTAILFNGGSANSSLNVLSNQWNMISFTYNKTNYKFKAYLNGQQIAEATSSDWAPYGSSTSLHIKFYEYNYLDEFSLWYSLLNSTDILTLYNNGNGLSYAQTMSSGNGFVNTTGNETNGTSLNYTITQYVCTNLTFKEIGTTNLCSGNFIQYNNGTKYCEPLVYGTNPNITCTYGCTYYGLDIGGFCNTNTTTNYSNNVTNIGNMQFSKNQCIVSSNIDYVCTNSIYKDNGVYCDLSPTHKEACPNYCITFIANQNDSDIQYFNTQKNCSTINKPITNIGMALYCSLEWVSTSFLETILIAEDLTSEPCRLYETRNLPTSKCTDDWTSVYDYYSQHTNDTFYVEGQCMDNTCISTCPQDAPSCNGITQIKTCVAYPDGCYRYNYTNCVSGKACTGGQCVTPGAIPGTEDNTIYTCGDDSLKDFFTGCGLSSTSKFLIVLVVMVITIIAFAFIGNSAGATKMGMIIGILLAIFEIIAFSVMGWIPAWVIILLTLVTLVILSFNLFVRDSGV